MKKPTMAVILACSLMAVASVSVLCFVEPVQLVIAKSKRWEPIATGAFADSIHHAVMVYEDQETPYERYLPEQIVHIAENLLAWQNLDGGWPKNKDWLRVLTPKERAELPHGQRAGEPSTLDNRNTWSQVEYLARVHQRTGLKRYADSAIRGIEYLLAQQRDSGGWRGADVEAITFNDDVMAGVLGTLKTALENRELYSFVDDSLRSKGANAYEKGLDCVLKCQIKVGDRLTAWGQQHDHKSSNPVWGRTFEPPSIASAESVEVVRFLMSIENPSPAIIQAVQSAVAWFDHVKLEGLRVVEIPAEPVRFPFHWSDSDLVAVQDPQAPPIWTRFYDLKTEQPIFCTRDMKITTDYTELGRERRTGYSWYGYWPARLLAEDYPIWREKWAQPDVLKRE